VLRVRGWLLAGVFAAEAAGCSFSGPPSGGDSDPLIDARNPQDPDGDGVSSATDNCADVANPDQRDSDSDAVGDACDNCRTTPNPARETRGQAGPVQRDHDADGTGDACDACPHVASPTPHGDQDGDGIGDSCDPEPSEKNPPAYFNGFYDPPDPASWETPGEGGQFSDWKLEERAGGQVGWFQSVLDGSKRHQLLLKGVRREHFVDSVMIIDQASAPDGSPLRSAGLTLGFERINTQDVYFTCGARRDLAANQSVVVASVLRDNQLVNERTQPWNGVLADVPIRLTARATRTNSDQPRMGGTELKCLAVSTEATHSQGTPYYPDGRIGFRTFGMSAWFDYVFVVEPVPAP